MEWSNPLAEAQWALPQRNGICSIFAGMGLDERNGSPNKLLYAGNSPRTGSCPTQDLETPGQAETCSPTTSPTVSPTAPTDSPTSAPTAPTAAPTLTPPSYIGPVACGDTVSGVRTTTCALVVLTLPP